jgi:hypothetical protein
MPIPENSTPAANSTPLNDLLTTREAAALIGTTANMLNTYRNRRNNTKYTNAGPDYVKLGTAVFYERSILQAYVANRAGY